MILILNLTLDAATLPHSSLRVAVVSIAAEQNDGQFSISLHQLVTSRSLGRLIMGAGRVESPRLPLPST